MGLLEGKVVLSTGGGPLQHAGATALAREGARVVLDGAEPDLVTRIEALGADVVSCAYGVGDPASAERLVATAMDRWGRLDVLWMAIAPGPSDRPGTWDAVGEQLARVHHAIGAARDALRQQGGSVVIQIPPGIEETLTGSAIRGGLAGALDLLGAQLDPLARINVVELRAATDPEDAAGLLVYLASDLAEGTAEVFVVEGPRLGVRRWQRSPGAAHDGPLGWTALQIPERIADIRGGRSEGAEEMAPDWGEPRLDDDTMVAVRPTRVWPIGKRYDGGYWLVDHDEALAFAEATNDDNPRYRHPDDVAPPMYHVRPFFGLLSEMAADPELELDPRRLVHSEYTMRFRRPLRHGEVLQLRGSLDAVHHEADGRAVVFALYGMVGGEIALEGSTTFSLRTTRPDAVPDPVTPSPTQPTPIPPPMWSIPQSVDPDQSRRYAAASGDHDPVHHDPGAAATAGLAGPSLHPLCTLALAQRDLIDRVAGGDPRRLRALSARLAGPAFLGETLTLEVRGIGDGGFTFVTHGPGGVPVLTHGHAEVAPQDGGDDGEALVEPDSTDGAVVG